MSAGVDAFKCDALFGFKGPFTCAKGAYSDSLAEFVIFGCLYFNKLTPLYNKLRKQHEWKKVPVGMVEGYTMGILGYGDIGVHCARLAKNGFNMTIKAFKRDPTSLNEQQKKYADEIYGNDKFLE